MSDTDAIRRKLDLARVFRDTFGVIRRQIYLLLGVAVVSYLLPALAIGAITRMLMAPLMEAVQADPTAIFRSPIYWGSLAVDVAIYAFAFACQACIALSDLEGRRTTAQATLKSGAVKTLPVLGTMVLAAVGIWIGSIFLLVPGVILALMWSVAAPVTVVETSNVFRSLGRSRALTKSNRWRVLGLALVTFMVLAVMYGVLAGVMGGGPAFGGATEPNLLITVISVIIGLVQTIVLSVASVALYVQLREIKGGGGEGVAQVFA